MKNFTWLWWVVGAVAAYFIFFKSKAAAVTRPAGAALSTGTMTTPADPFSGWLGQTDLTLKATTATISDFTALTNSLTAGISSLFGTPSPASGSPSPSSSGGGAGTPVNYGNSTYDSFSDMFGGWE